MVNAILIILVIIAVLVYIAHKIKENQNAETESVVEQDDQTYTLDKMIIFIKKRLDEITKVNLYDIGLSEEELKRRKNKKYELKKALKGCTYGDVNDKKYIKELIYDLLSKEYGVTETNISKAIPFDIPAKNAIKTMPMINAVAKYILNFSLFQLVCCSSYCCS